MEYRCALLAVKDVRRSLAFYQKWFDLEVEVDLGWNIGLKGGLALQEHFAELIGLPPESVMTRSHNMELYFECEDLDAFERRLGEDRRWSGCTRSRNIPGGSGYCASTTRTGTSSRSAKA
jgi:catechol 2,3-dioxygenase-like lactoylglutathione lyase family enzyme